MGEIIETIQNSFTNLVETLGSYLPDLGAGLLILIVGWVVARLARGLVSQIGQRLSFDRLVERTGLTQGLRQAAIHQTPTQLAALLVFWILFLNFLLAALNRIGLSEAVQPLQDFIAFLPSIVTALVTLILGALAAQFIGRAVQGAVAGMGIEFHQAVGNLVRLLLMGVVVIIVIEQMGLDVTLLTNLFTSTLTIVVAGLALAFGLGGRDVARNVLAGFYARELFEVGDTVVVDGQEGTLEGIGTLNAEIRIGPDRLTVPNTRLTEAQVIKRGS